MVVLLPLLMLLRMYVYYFQYSHSRYCNGGRLTSTKPACVVCRWGITGFGCGADYYIILSNAASISLLSVVIALIAIIWLLLISLFVLIFLITIIRPEEREAVIAALLPKLATIKQIEPRIRTCQASWGFRL